MADAERTADAECLFGRTEQTIFIMKLSRKMPVFHVKHEFIYHERATRLSDPQMFQMLANRLLEHALIKQSLKGDRSTALHLSQGCSCSL